MDSIVTVKDLINFLQTNFRQNDKLCWWHEGGAWCECENVRKADIGKWFLRRLADEMHDRWNDLSARDPDYKKENFNNDYRLIDNPNNFVLIY